MLRYALYRAYESFRAGEPMELDIYTTILDHGLEPESVMDAFEKGAGPQDIYDAFTERIDVEYILVKEKN